ncbi:MAG: hypothetical protein Q8P44_05300 [Dehalococcoidia bacterium]|nr:hypothetical protein [Dehalococcoidia bacterium]
MAQASLPAVKYPGAMSARCERLLKCNGWWNKTISVFIKPSAKHHKLPFNPPLLKGEIGGFESAFIKDEINLTHPVAQAVIACGLKCSTPSGIRGIITCLHCGKSRQSFLCSTPSGIRGILSRWRRRPCLRPEALNAFRHRRYYHPVAQASLPAA